MAKIFVQDPFNPICFSENSDKYIEVDSIICILTTWGSREHATEFLGTGELDESEFQGTS